MPTSTEPNRFSERSIDTMPSRLLRWSVQSIAEVLLPSAPAATMIRLKSLVAHPMARVRLLCIPYAGAGIVSFRPWAKLLPPHVEAFAVQLPGRENRIADTPFTDWGAMRHALIDAVSALPAFPTVIFGHSLGAVIGLDLARYLQQSSPSSLVHLFVSGHPWPGGLTHHAGNTSDLDDSELLQLLNQRYGSLDTSLSHPEIREVVMRALRADLQLLNSYRYSALAPLTCPLTAFMGCNDPATTIENVEAWRQESTGLFRAVSLKGNHFFIESQRTELVSTIVSSL
jgi:surfactin synthase thioesterase subunit